MVEHGAEAILRIVVFERLLNGFGYRYPEGTAAVGILRKNRPARFGKGARRGNGTPAENLHHRFAVRLLLKRAPHHEHGAFKPENVARLRERRPPLARAGLGRHLLVPHLLFSNACAIALLVLCEPDGLTPSYLK